MNRNKASRRLRTMGRFVLSLALLSQTLLIGLTPVMAQKRPAGKTNVLRAKGLVNSSTQTPDQVQSEVIRPVSTTVVNFQELSERQARQPAAKSQRTEYKPAPAPMTIPESEPADAEERLIPPAPPIQSDVIPGPSIPSPTPSTNFQGEVDQAQGGGPSGTFTIPPDTMGAVGIDKVFVTLNNNYKIQNKVTGAQLSLVSIETFWNSSGGTGVFDPRVQYDPYNNRWILTAVSNAVTANSSVLVGLSNTSDPQGTYTLFRFIVGCAAGSMGCSGPGEWADFPMLGFNKNWVAIGWNQFTIPGAFVAGKMLVLDYPTLRTGTATGTLFTNPSGATGFCMHPVTTFSPTENTLYVPTHQQSAGALYRLHTITGTPGAPTFTLGLQQTRPGGGWTQPGGDVLPQQCIPGVGAPTQTCPATPRGLDASDAFVRSNAVFRNGKIWYPQAIALPAGGLTATSRFVAQWTALNPDGTFFDGGRVEDATATPTNGGKHYSYPSLSVNKNNDVLFGFSEFESDDYVDAGYTFRLGTDAAGTMRDPIIYKEGEDYYSKTFGTTRNRWGDYSHTVVDPVNDRDLWTIQEYAGLRVGVTGEASNDSRWATWWAKVSAPAGAGDLLITEFRLRGPGGPNDEFIEIYNNNDSPLTVLTLDGSAGYSVVAQDNTARFTIPNGTVIPGRGHYLGVNSVAYSLASYPAGNGTTATGDATYTTDIPDNNGIAIFNSSTTFTAAERLDSVGSTTTPVGLFKEGTGVPVVSIFQPEYSFLRDNCGKGGAIAAGGPCPSGGFPVDTNNNAADFYFVDTQATSIGAGQRLGAPGPENLSSPVQRNSSYGLTLLDPGSAASGPPNRVRDLTPGPVATSALGTMSIRRTVTNNTPNSTTRLRFRIVDVTPFPPPPGFADIRAITSPTLIMVTIVGPNPACPANMCAVQGTTLEEPPTQPNGGGFNSTLSAGVITLAAPLAPGGTVNVQFLVGVKQTGTFRFFINVEALP